MDDATATKFSAPKHHAPDALGDAWDHFYAHCAAIIGGCPSVRRLSDSDREDCVQEVMCEIVRKFGERRPEALSEELPAWIRTVSRNKAVDIVRRRSRKQEVGFDDGSGEAIPDEGPSLEQAEYVSLVWEALVSLDQKVPVTSYLVFYLHTIEGWDFNEIAELFQLTPGTARTRAHRVKEKFDALVRRIDSQGQEPE
ncbi:MAG: RNA polymerase sigma factor [Isosphaeraceae bacterium]